MKSLDDLKAAKKQIADLKKATAKQVKTLFHTAAKELFKETPDLVSVSWTQYTPYFNDGDTCEFSSGHDYPDINGVEDDYDDDDEESEGKSPAEAWDELGSTRQKAVEKNVKAFLKHWDDDDMYDLFGDHVKVTVTAKGIEVDDYEHD